jgi:hypothetical protein
MRNFEACISTLRHRGVAPGPRDSAPPTEIAVRSTKRQAIKEGRVRMGSSYRAEDAWERVVESRKEEVHGGSR